MNRKRVLIAVAAAACVFLPVVPTNAGPERPDGTFARIRVSPLRWVVQKLWLLGGAKP